MNRKIVLFLILFVSTCINLFSGEPEKLVFLKQQAAKQKKADSYLYVSEYYIKNKINTREVYGYLDSAYRAAVKEKSDLYLGQYYYQRALICDNYGLDSASAYRDFMKKSVRHYEKAGLTSYHAYSYALIGISLFTSNKLDSAIVYLRKGLKKYQNNPLLPAAEVHKLIHTFMLQSFKALGQHDSAVVYGHKVLDLAVQLKDSATLGEYSYTLATVYRDMGKFPEALNYFKQAIEVGVKTGNYRLAANSYEAMGSVYGTLENYEKALQLYKEGLKYAQKSRDKNVEGGSWGSIAWAYVKLGKYKEAEAGYRKALKCYSETKNEKFYQLMSAAMMDLFSQTNQQDSAWKYMNKLETVGELPFDADSLAIPNSFQELMLKQYMWAATAEERQAKLDVVKQQYLEQEAAALRHRIWFIAILSGLVILLLLLLINRQRQKIKAERMARYAKEKEDEFMALQKDTELRLIRKYIDGLENERGRIAKDIHDGICNDLLALEMELKALPAGKQETEQVLALLTGTRESARNISHKLMPPVFQDATIDEMLSDYVSHLELPDPVKMDYSSTDGVDWNRIPQEIAYEIYRIVQEALSNCIKHASATHINVSLVMENDVLRTIVRDNGVGFDKTKKNKGIGLRTIADRVKTIGGELRIDSGKNGTSIKITVQV